MRSIVGALAALLVVASAALVPLSPAHPARATGPLSERAEIAFEIANGGPLPASATARVTDATAATRTLLVSEVLTLLRSAEPGPRPQLVYPLVANDVGILSAVRTPAIACWATIPASAINVNGGPGYLVQPNPRVVAAQAPSPCTEFGGFPTYSGDWHGIVADGSYGEVCAAVWADLPTGGCILDGFKDVYVVGGRLGFLHIDACFPDCVTVDLLYDFSVTGTPREPGLITIQ